MRIKNIQGQTWIIVILVLLNLGTLGFIYMHRPGFALSSPNFNPKERMHRFMDKRLGFDSKQSDEFREIQDKHFKEMKGIRKDIMDRKHELYDRILNNELNDEDLQKLSNELAKLYVQQEMINYRHIKQVRAICTPEQAEKMKTIYGHILYHQRYPYSMKQCRDSYMRRKKSFYNNNH